MRYVSWNLVNCCSVRKLHFKRLVINRRMTFKVTQGHQNWRNSIGHVQLPITVVCSSNVAIFHHFRDHTKFYSVRDCLWPWVVLQFQCDIWNYRSRMLSDSCVKYIVLNTCYISRNLGVRKVSNSHVDLQGGSINVTVLVSSDKPYMLFYWTSTVANNYLVNLWKFAGVPQTRQRISGASGLKFTIL